MKRRDFIIDSAAVLAAANLIATPTSAQDATAETAALPNASQGRVHHSVMGWCFKPMSSIELAKHGLRIGLEAIEGIPSSDYPAVTQLGLKISLVGSHGFAQGPLNPEFHPIVESKLREGIDLAVKFGAPNVITFTGMSVPGMSDQAATRNCLECWKRVLPYAEEKNVGLVLEHLNSRDDSHPMKGHPGYWGDDLHRCVDLVKAMDSPNFRLLFDVYHVQIMHGDIIRHINQYHSYVGHYHTAGNPGRGELDDTQEINYPAVIRAIVDTGYQGYLAHEFIPTRPDPMLALSQAVKTCDV